MKHILIRCDGYELTKAGLGTQHFDKEIIISRFPPNNNLHLKLTNITHTICRTLDPLPLDLLELASFVYAADSDVDRGLDTDILGNKWNRHLTFVVPCRNPDLWNSNPVNSLLARMLKFLSDDEYSFHFVKGEYPPQQQFLEFYGPDLPPFKGADSVGLFSGGLDSLAGIIADVKAGRRPILISHRSRPTLSSLQKQLINLMGERINQWNFPHISLWVNRRGQRAHEFTQRTRSFLYLSLAASVAFQCGLDEIRFFENGVVSLNIPILGQNIGTFLTRTTHPKFIHEFNEFVSLVLGKRMSYVNPFLQMTKGEVVHTLKDNGCPELIEAAVSCAHTWMTDKLQRHCGTCSQCVDRRFAIASQGLENHDPIHGYKKDLFLDELEEKDRACAVGYIKTAVEILKMGEEEFFTKFSPIYDALDYWGGSSVQAAQGIYDLFQRWAKQINSVMQGKINQYSGSVVSGNLPNSCLVVMVGGQRHLDTRIDFNTIETPTAAQSIKFEIPPISKTEKSKYVQYYHRKDVIEFLDREAGVRSYVIKVNGREVPVPYSEYALLLFLAIKLKADIDDGWTTSKEIEAEEIINAQNITHLHRLVSDLKKIINPFVETDIKEELIQNIKRTSRYRLSTMPSRIKTPHSRWLKQKFRLVKNSVLEERQKRVRS